MPLPPRRTGKIASCQDSAVGTRVLVLRRFGRKSEQASRWARSCGAVGDFAPIFDR